MNTRALLVVSLLALMASLPGSQSAGGEQADKTPSPNDDSHIPKVFEVGPGQQYSTIEAACAAASSGDTVLVHALDGDAPYRKPALFVSKAKIKFSAAPAKGKKYVRIDGEGFNYTGAGSTPRAVFQFNKGADGCIVEGFEIFNARNDSNNGAAIRINEANDVTIRYCEIRNNDMGVMSNGSVADNTGANQRFEFCLVHDNGTDKEPGYNHNFYLGGTSVVIHCCEIRNSTTGHNFKSRAHFNWVEYSFVHDSSNREFDLVDGAGNTSVPGSHTVLLGNVIAKANDCTGNRAVIHFGQDGGKGHDGTLYLVNNTIVTPFASPVIDLSAAKAGTRLLNNLVFDGGVNGQHVLVNAANGADLANVSGECNWLSRGFDPMGAMDSKTNVLSNSEPPFVAPGRFDWRLIAGKAGEFRFGKALDKLGLPSPNDGAPTAFTVFRQYLHPLQVLLRTDAAKPFVGSGIK